MESRIGMICSNLKLAEKVKRVSERLGFSIEIRMGTLEKAIPMAKNLERDGIEVLISRGGTAAILKAHLSIPVLSIPFSTNDLLENVLEASKYGKKIGINIYENPISGIEMLEQIIQAKVRQIIYHDSESLRMGIIQAKNEGIEVFIGGGFAFETCQQMGIPCVMKSSSEESIKNAIDEARVVASIRVEEREKTKRVEAILNSVSEGMIAIDKNGIVTIFNKVAEDILGIKGALGRHINSVLPRLGLYDVLKTGTTKLQSLQKVGETQIVANLVPIFLGKEIIGAIASFTDVSKVMKAEQKVRQSFTRGFVAKYTLSDLVHESQSMKRVIEQTKRFAQTDSTILLTGESGTGKELLAHSIHNLSSRKNGPFVTINCSALPDNLLETELFGYEEGAFTGARKGGKIGLFELAHRGTIFLDEIGSISESVQSRLLRVLQEKEVMRVGGDRIIPIDVRIIAATNKNLIKLVREGRIRRDLYFRLNILKIHIPPLRKRKEDIPLLVRSIFEGFSISYKKKIEPLSENLIKKFIDYSWPGNVRELQSFIERFVLLVDKPEEYENILDDLFEECSMSEKILVLDKIDEFISEEKRNIFDIPFYKKTDIAKMMGISRTTLWRKLRNTNLEN